MNEQDILNESINKNEKTEEVVEEIRAEDSRDTSEFHSNSDQILELITDACQTVYSEFESGNTSFENSLISECKRLTKSFGDAAKKSNEFDFGNLKSKIEKSYKQISISKKMKKYYNRRYMLFTRFDEGCLLDTESWFSVTPEKTARHIANQVFEKMGNTSDLTILDGFCGSGGNTIQFCKYFENVISSDIDLVKLQCAQQNSKIYKTEDRVKFIQQDFFSLHTTLRQKVDVIFLSPPWGGVNYFHSKEADISEFPLDCFKIFLYCVNMLNCRNIVFFLPRNTNLEQILLMAGPGGKCQIEQNFIDHKLVAITAYYGDLCENSHFVNGPS